MAATFINHTMLTGVGPAREQTEAGDADRFMRNLLLSELPGAAFAFLTLAYIIVSLASL
jgi:hypothetical protein